MKKKSKITALVLVILILVIIGVIISTRSPDAIEVTTEQVDSGPLRSIVSASGNIVPHKAINISANVIGEIKKIPVEEGYSVKKGDLLIVIDPELYLANLKREEASLSSAEAELALARSTFERAEKIYSEEPQATGESLISKEEYESLLAEYRIAQSNWNRVNAQVESARANLEKTSIYSSISGVVTSLNVEVGEVAITGTMNNPGTVLMTISDLSRMQAEIEVDETDIVQVNLGQETEVTIDAYPDTIFIGVVSEIGNSPIISRLGGGGEETIDFKVVIDMLDPPGDLKPGLSTTADIITDSREEALFIAIQALTMRAEKNKAAEGDSNGEKAPRPTRDGKKEKEIEGVFVVTDDTAIFTPVVTGISDGMNIEIVSGLLEGDEIITGSFKTIRTLTDSSSVNARTSILSEGETEP
jgi:HlyD family secretion protein